MTLLNTQGISLYYEVHGDPANPPVLLLSGLGGTRNSWSNQVERFAAEYYVIVSD
jgi:aminoacrylate hydrolase